MYHKTDHTYISQFPAVAHQVVPVAATRKHQSVHCTRNSCIPSLVSITTMSIAAVVVFSGHQHAAVAEARGGLRPQELTCYGIGK